MAFDPNYYLQSNPDVLNAYYEALSTPKGQIALQQYGASSPEEYATQHLLKYGQYENRPGTNGAPAPAPAVDTPPPNVIPYTPAPGAVGDPNNSLEAVRAQQRINLITTLNNQGYGNEISRYMPEFESYLDQVAGFIPEGATNYSSYFDPNAAGAWFTGRQVAQSRTAGAATRQAFNPSFATSKISDTFLDQTINDLLEGQYKEAQTAFERGKARGQFNDAGYEAGIGGLGTAKTAAAAKLNAYENDILSSYRGKIADVGNRANQASSMDGFDLSQFMSEADNIANQFTTNAAGEFLNLAGGEKLFDLGTLLNKAGSAQGVQNLPNVDVLEAIEKRKQKDSTTRGLGAQGTF